MGIQGQGGGSDLEWLKPLTPEGHVDSDDPSQQEMIGGHRGTTEFLNIPNPQPGFEYAWARNDAASLIREAQRGGQVVQAEDPEASIVLEGLGGTPLDTGSVVGDVVKVRRPAEAVRKIREQEQELSRQMMRSGADEFISKGTAAESQYAGHGKSLRFAGRDHRLQYEDVTGELADEWRPDRGILED